VTGTYALPPGKALTVGMKGNGGNPTPPSNFTVNDVECDTRASQRPPGSALPPMTDLVPAPKDKERPSKDERPPPPPGGDRRPPPGDENGRPPSGRPSSTAPSLSPRYVVSRA
jgi:eukaryotic-like serine/threonine-protein kinase